MGVTTVKVPATSKGPETTVVVHEDGKVYTTEGVLIGAISKGSYTYSPKAAGHSGRIARYHTEVAEWEALTPADLEKSSTARYPYRGGTYPSHYRKNTRKAALAFLAAVASGTTSGDARYFVWERL